MQTGVVGGVQAGVVGGVQEGVVGGVQAGVVGGVQAGVVGFLQKGVVGCLQGGVIGCSQEGVVHCVQAGVVYLQVLYACKSCLYLIRVQMCKCAGVQLRRSMFAGCFGCSGFKHTQHTHNTTKLVAGHRQKFLSSWIMLLLRNLRKRGAAGFTSGMPVEHLRLLGVVQRL